MILKCAFQPRECVFFFAKPGMHDCKMIWRDVAVRGLLVEDKAAVERLRSQTKPRKAQYARPGMRAGSVQISLTGTFMAKIRKKGGENSRKYLPKRLVKRLARRAAAARWAKP